MIILDTNVVSEPFKPTPNPGLVAWLDQQDRDQLFLTAISFAELIVGHAWLPDGRRKRELGEKIAQFVEMYFADRILAFDREAAFAAGIVVNRARAQGYNIGNADGQIAAIAHARGFSVATRDVHPFLAAGVKVIDPWLAAG